MSASRSCCSSLSITSLSWFADKGAMWSVLSSSISTTDSLSWLDSLPVDSSWFKSVEDVAVASGSELGTGAAVASALMSATQRDHTTQLSLKPRPSSFKGQQTAYNTRVFEYRPTHRLNDKLILNEIQQKHNLLLIIVVVSASTGVFVGTVWLIGAERWTAIRQTVPTKAPVEAETSTIINKRLCFYWISFRISLQHYTTNNKCRNICYKFFRRGLMKVRKLQSRHHMGIQTTSIL